MVQAVAFFISPLASSSSSSSSSLSSSTAAAASSINQHLVPITTTAMPSSSPTATTLADVVRMAYHKNIKMCKQQDRMALRQTVQQSQFWRHLQHTFLEDPQEGACLERMTVPQFEAHRRRSASPLSHTKPVASAKTDLVTPPLHQVEPSHIVVRPCRRSVLASANRVGICSTV
ncbi:uncharacterized protein MONBRDRAFT_28961 [Monosiga brevicollis MX1]|uniref:Uncharacterized protein n=1 Tax=Monosiga brevicollis TaxID=81824 RepID=A9V9N9_MONBE|nr:uncharacterized protein MONBRDRAFT_28959 [Monosiga brevicollis MX1]XP_001749469.1 uncharacterized protein MONBRDRAFT_28960 [Monosiga brevicollis MX1]XP_001749470.1 uncharacterized protein MONBRDRAFT_28961 [Monosiga brevicollis MX1]EDQ85753.1 predicted protein [Monosiga brevicollis MX1]EDQ85754.1 predicted protein [Monosiga brevicollis MX1]EDQ85755.1 predicted protein [Monosiga brevicollis MX1]|eukprot:XP_001749468.1 hypothetical protein [Monosiga brevicollis MX1]